MSNIIQKFTKDEYSHAAISFNSALDPMYTFGNKNATTLKGDAGFVIQNPKSEFELYIIIMNTSVCHTLVFNKFKWRNNYGKD